MFSLIFIWGFINVPEATYFYQLLDVNTISLQY
jgi:hypothetical protein